MGCETETGTVRHTADVVLLTAASQVLLIERDSPPYRARWALPGGHVDPGEDTLDAAVRELAEETGIRVSSADLRFVGRFDEPGRDPRGRYITDVYTATVPEPLLPVAGDDARAARWWEVDGLPRPLAFDHDVILDAVLGTAPSSSCGECRYDFGEDPVRLSERCAAFSADMGRLLQETEREVLLRRPDPHTWSPLEYAAHVSEAVPWYVERVQRVLRCPVPQLHAYDWDQAASDGNYRERSVETVTGDLWRACAALAEVAGSISAEDLARTGTGSDGTPRTVRTLLARAGHELAHHELDMRRGVEAAEGSARTPRPPQSAP